MLSDDILLSFSSADFSSLRGCITFLEIVFVGQCEVFVCLDFFLSPLAVKLIGPRTGCQFFKKC